MKTVIFLAFIAALAFAAPEYYNVSKVDVDKLSKDPKEFKRVVDCILDKGPCSSIFVPYRAIVQESIQTACSKCSPDHKRSFGQFLQALKKNAPKDYDDFRQKYDADNKYFDMLESTLSRS